MPFPKSLVVFSGLMISGLAALAADAPASGSLKDAAHGLFHVGAAINNGHITGEDASGVALIGQHFDSITPENVMKWEKIHPEAGRFDFDLPDKFVGFGARRGLWVVGHTLMWHSQTPAWVFQDAKGQDISREALLERLRDHIRTVVGRYRGKVKGWDVVNEAINDEDGTLRLDKPWYRILGVDGIYAAFEAAHEADPDAELYYNDYSLANPVKRAGVINLAQSIRDRGLRIDGIGSQEHSMMNWPSAADVDATMRDIGAAGFKAMVTELDVTVLPRPSSYAGAEVSTSFKGAKELDPYREGLPAEQEELLAKRYGELFAVYAKHATTVTRVTFWGVTDRGSWLNNWPIKGRTDYALLFDRSNRPKSAFGAVVKALKAAPRP